MCRNDDSGSICHAFMADIRPQGRRCAHVSAAPHMEETRMTTLVRSLLGACALTTLSLSAYADTTLTIATVNNGDMIRMQGLTDDFTKANPDIKLNWVTLEENELRQKVTTDIATKSGQFDVDDHRQLRNADLGQEGLARSARQARRRLRRQRPAAGHPRRPVLRRQALRRAVLRRELDAHVPQGLDGQGRAQDAREADLGPSSAKPRTR